jgi:acyl carrier protein
MSDLTTTRDAVRTVLAAHGSLRTDPWRMAPTDDLYAAGLTSMASVHVLLAVEAALGIEFPERALDRALFSSIDSLATTAATCLRDTEPLRMSA